MSGEGRARPAPVPEQEPYRVEVRLSAAGMVGMVILAVLVTVLGGAIVAGATFIDQWSDPPSVAAGITGVVIAVAGVLALVALPRITAPTWLTFHRDRLEYIGRPATLSVPWRDVEWLFLTAPGKLGLLVRWSPMVQLIVRVNPEAAAVHAATRGRVGKQPALWDHTRVVMFWAGKESKRAIAAGCEAYAGERFQGPRW